MRQPTEGQNGPLQASDVAKGALAGALGGAVGALVMDRAMRLMQRAQQNDQEQEKPDNPESPGDPKIEFANRYLVEPIKGREMSEDVQPVAAQAVHYGMGMVSGAIYGAAAEVSDLATVGHGTAFGAAVWAGASQTTMPLLDLAPPPWDQPTQQQAMMLGMHALYGAITETVRKPVRDLMG